MQMQTRYARSRYAYFGLAMLILMSTVGMNGECTDDLITDDMISAAAREVLSRGGTLEDAQAAMQVAMAADPNVSTFMWDESQGIGTVTFADGHIELFQIIDLRDETIAAQRAAAANAEDAPSQVMRSDAALNAAHEKRATTALENLNDVGPVVPGNNRALVANSLSVFTSPLPHVQTDMTEPVKQMLEEVSYDVDHEPLTVETFRKLDQYGVIYLEALGGTRQPDATDAAIDPLGANDGGYCGGTGSLEVIHTITQADKATRERYRADLDCRRLIVTNITLVTSTISPRTDAFLSVTPNFLRQYTAGTSPDATVMFVNGCQGMRDQSGSNFAAWLFGNVARGAVYMSWSAQPGDRESALLRGVNMMSLLTGSSRQEVRRRNGSVMELKSPQPAFRGETVAVAKLMMRDRVLDQIFALGGGIAELQVLYSGFDNPSLMPIIAGAQFYEEDQLWVTVVPYEGALAVLPNSGAPEGTSVSEFINGPFWEVNLPPYFRSGELIATAPSGQQSRPFTMYEWEPLTFEYQCLNADDEILDNMRVTVKIDRGILLGESSDRWNAPVNIIEGRIESIAWEVEGAFATPPTDCMCDDDNNVATPDVVCGSRYYTETLHGTGASSSLEGSTFYWSSGNFASINVVVRESIDPATNVIDHYGIGPNCEDDHDEQDYSIAPHTWIPMVEVGPDFNLLGGSTLFDRQLSSYAVLWGEAAIAPAYDPLEHRRR